MKRTGGDEHVDVTIVGGGVIGLACAVELLEAGRSVRILERDVVGSGASHGNAGLVTPSHATPLTRPGAVTKVLRWMLQPSSPIYVRLRLDPALVAFGLRFARACRERAMLHTMQGRAAILNSSRTLFDEWMSSGDLACEWEEAGLLLVFDTREAFEEEGALHATLEEFGVHAHLLDGPELVRREPSLREGLAGGAWYPRDAHLRPDLLVAGLARRVRERGGLIEESCGVEGFDQDAGRVVGIRTTRGTWRTRDLVLATGAWAPELGRRLGLRLLVQPGRGYSLTLPRPEEGPRLPMILEEAAMGVTPWPSGLRLAGTMEFNGFAGAPRPERFEAMRAGARRYLGVELDTAAAEEWTGWRAMTPDELPIIGRSPRLANVWVATGHGRMGVSMAPGTARLVRELLTGGEAHLDPAPYAPSRFA
jgi:D-amino-acid dehydrogenase